MIKEDLRSELLSLRDNTPASPSESRAIAKNLLENFDFPDSSIIGAYWPIRNEANPKCLLNQVHKMGHAIALPEIISKSKSLNFRKWCPHDSLKPGKFGISEPRKDQPSLQPNIFLVPLVGFDDQGRRLGYGGGYYDRTIDSFKKNNKKIILIGIARELQRVEFVPNFVHDQKMDIIVTEKKFERVQ